MKDYTQLFDNAGYAFILKPIELRYVPRFIDKPKCQITDVSFEPKESELPGGAGTLVV